MQASLTSGPVEPTLQECGEVMSAKVLRDRTGASKQAGFVQKAVEMWHQALAICPDAAMRQTIKDHLLRLI